MTIHTDLPIYRTGVELMNLAIDAQAQMPRGIKRSLGDKISQHCVEMLDEMALANATQREERAHHIDEVLKRQRAVTVLLRVTFDRRNLSPKLWATSVTLLDSIGKQCGGWKKSASKRPAA